MHINAIYHLKNKKNWNRHRNPMIQNRLCCTCYGLRIVTMSPAPTSLSPSTKVVPPPELPHRSGRRRCQLKDPNPAMSPHALSIGSEPLQRFKNGNHHCLRKHPNQATPKVGPPKNKKKEFSRHLTGIGCALPRENHNPRPFFQASSSSSSSCSCNPNSGIRNIQKWMLSEHPYARIARNKTWWNNMAGTQHAEPISPRPHSRNPWLGTTAKVDKG